MATIDGGKVTPAVGDDVTLVLGERVISTPSVGDSVRAALGTRDGDGEVLLG